MPCRSGIAVPRRSDLAVPCRSDLAVPCRRDLAAARGELAAVRATMPCGVIYSVMPARPAVGSSDSSAYGGSPWSTRDIIVFQAASSTCSYQTPSS